MYLKTHFFLKACFAVAYAFTSSDASFDLVRIAILTAINAGILLLNSYMVGRVYTPRRINYDPVLKL